MKLPARRSQPSAVWSPPLVGDVFMAHSPEQARGGFTAWAGRALRGAGRVLRVLGAELRSISFQDFWGQARDVTSIRSDSIQTALTLGPVYAATRLLADSTASLPLHAYRQVGDVKQKADLPDLLEDPTMHGTGYDWVFRAVTSLALRGNAFGYVTVFDADGFARQLEWLHPDEVTVGDNRAVSQPEWFWRGRPIEAGRLLHIPGYVLPGMVLGLSPISAYALTIETGLSSQRYGRDWFNNGSVPSAVLETAQPVDQTQASIIKARFRAAASGREPVVLGAGVAYKPISVAPEEAQFLETIKATATQIAAIYGIPPERIGGESGSSLTYSTLEQNDLSLAKYTLRPYLVRLETALSRLLPDGLHAKFNIDALVRADLATRYRAHALALEYGWKTVNEVRALEDLAPVPGGDVLRPVPEPTDGKVSAPGIRRLRSVDRLTESS